MIRLLQHPAALIFLCFALLGTPVSYRGGASDAHPHMFFEFLLDATAGAFDHHHGDEPAEAAEPSNGHDHAHTGDDHAEAADTDPAPDGPAVEGADRFAPSLSAFVVGDVGQLASILPQHELPLTGDFATAFQPFGTAPDGLTHAPTAPPPR
jgi:hypothetical protein